MAQQNGIQRDTIWDLVVLEATARDVFVEKVKHPMIIHGVEFIYSEATDAAIATLGVVSFDTAEGAGARTERATYTAELSKAIGFTGQLKDANSEFNLRRVLDVGDTMYFEHKTAQTATEAGEGRFVYWWEGISDGEV